MKTLTIIKTHVVFFETIQESYKINEIIDSEGILHFSVGEIGHYADMVRVRGITLTVNNILEGACNFFEAQARLIEKLLREGAGKIRHSPWSLREGAGKALMKELGLKNLPLLLNFFKEPEVIEILGEVLKGGEL